MEKQPAFDRVIGGTEEHTEAFWSAVGAEGEKLKRENLGEILSELSEGERKSVDHAVTYANEIAHKYGATRTVNSENIFILQEGMTYKLTKGRLRNGFYNAATQSAFVDRVTSFAVTLSRVVHECFHATSLQVVKLYEDSKYKPYRSGLELMSIKEGVQTDFFQVAQEAIIATLTYRYFNEVLKNDSEFTDQITKTEIVKNWLTERSSSEKTREIIESILIIPGAEEWCVKIENTDEDKDQLFDNFIELYNTKLRYLDLDRERPEERKKFDAVLDEIIERSNGKIQDKDGLFDEFARAHFTGSFMPLARIIEDALGKGSFREIAKRLARPEAKD